MVANVHCFPVFLKWQLETVNAAAFGNPKEVLDHMPITSIDMKMGKSFMERYWIS